MIAEAALRSMAATRPARAVLEAVRHRLQQSTNTATHAMAVSAGATHFTRIASDNALAD